MADTIREKIITAFINNLTTWVTSSGYNYSCGSSVVRAKSTIEENQLPAVVLWPQAETVEYVYDRNICSMLLKVEAIAMISTENRSVVQEKLLGDAIKIMSATDSEYVTDIAYSGGGPSGVDRVEDIITAIVAEFMVKYETNAGDPYNN